MEKEEIKSGRGRLLCGGQVGSTPEMTSISTSTTMVMNIVMVIMIIIIIKLPDP